MRTTFGGRGSGFFSIVFVIVTLVGCSGTSELANQREVVIAPTTGGPNAPFSSSVTTTGVRVEPSTSTTTTPLSIGPLDRSQVSRLISDSGLGELQKFNLALLDMRSNPQGGSTKLFSLNGGAPVVSNEEVIVAVNNYSTIAAQGREVEATITMGTATSLTATFLLTPRRAVNHHFFFGDSTFVPFRDMPVAFGRIADVNSPGVSYLPQHGHYSKVASGFLADSSSQRIVDGTIDNAQYGVNVEACQNTLDVQPAVETTSALATSTTADPLGIEITAERLQSFGQELVCNSMGLARAYKMVGQTYEQYKAMAENVHMDLYKPRLANFHVVERAIWDQL